VSDFESDVADVGDGRSVSISHLPLVACSGTVP